LLQSQNMALEAILSFLAFALLGVLSQGEPPLLLSSECCYNMTVGGQLYTQVAGDTIGFPECVPGCVYEQEDIPDSRFCFKHLNINDGGGVVECKETERKLGTVHMVRGNESILFCDNGTVLNCTIDINSQTNITKKTVCTNITGEHGAQCKNSTGATDLSSNKRTGDDFAYTVESESQIIYHMPDLFIHCYIPIQFNTSSICNASLGHANRVYVQNSFANISSQDECKEMCNKTRNCTFWTFSNTTGTHDDHDHNSRLKRNHQGIPECGIRTYEANMKIIIKIPKPGSYNPKDGSVEYVNDTRQSCGLFNQSEVFTSQVFVQDVFRSPDTNDCAQKAQKPAKDFPFTSWKFWTYDFSQKTCVLANYEPYRSIQVLPYHIFGPLGIASGIVDEELLATWDSLTEYPWMKSTPSPPK